MARFIMLILLCAVLILVSGALWADASGSLLHSINQAYRDWEAYKGMHPTKRYANESEENEHMLAFLRAQQKVHRHNEAYSRGEVSFELDAWNPLSDLPFAKYIRRNGYRPRLYDGARPKNSSLFLAPMNAGLPPASVDWRDHGYVTKVMDQGDCGSCWAISAVGSLEGQHKRATGVLVALSAQNLVDCTNNEKYGNAGCHGGWMDAAFQYISDNKGVDKEFYYPYHGLDERCMFDDMTIGAVDTGFVDLKMGDEEMLKVAVATQGPISVTIDAGHYSFALYKSGVYYEKECSSTTPNHAVLVVGYGTDPQHGDYWIVKNSWGNDWGEAGYIRMSRNKNNQCGIATKASYPLV